MVIKHKPVTMHSDNMIRYHHINIFIDSIQHNKQQVESREQRILQTDILHRSLVLIVLKSIMGKKNTQNHKTDRRNLSINGIGGCEYRTTGIQARVNPSFRYCNSALFHNFVYSGPIYVRHLIEFIDANDSSVTKNHCTCF